MEEGTMNMKKEKITDTKQSSHQNALCTDTSHYDSDAPEQKQNEQKIHTFGKITKIFSNSKKKSSDHKSWMSLPKIVHCIRFRNHPFPMISTPHYRFFRSLFVSHCLYFKDSCTHSSIAPKNFIHRLAFCWVLRPLGFNLNFIDKRKIWK